MFVYKVQWNKDLNPIIGSSTRSFLTAFSICIVTLVVFIPALQCDFTNWDDNFLITKNPLIKDFSITGIGKIFSSFSLNHYHPFVLLTYAIEYKLFGLSPFHFHLSNVILHALNVLLVYFLAKLIIGNKISAIIVALLFAIHPLRVESVVWIAERKDVLSTFFIFLSLISYIYYRTTNNNFQVVFAFVFFISALLSKAMAITTPLLFILYDYYKEGKLEKNKVYQLIPFFSFSFLFGVIAVIAQYSTGFSANDPTFNFLKSFFLPTHSLVFYLVKFLYPFNLSPVYPYPEIVGANYSMLFWLSPLIVALIVYLVYRFGRQNRLLIFGFLFYLISMLPVIQFIPVGRMIAADRFSYLPLFGIMLIISQIIPLLINTFNKKYFLKILLFVNLVGIGLLLSILTSKQISAWETSITLWNKVIQDNPLYAEGYNNLGLSYAEKEEFNEALKNFNYAISIDSTNAEFFYNRGLLLLQTKQYTNAIKDFSFVITLQPFNLFAYFLKGNAHFENRDFNNAIHAYSIILEKQPYLVDVRMKRLKAFQENKDYDKAMEDYRFLKSMGVDANSNSNLIK